MYISFLLDYKLLNTYINDQQFILQLINSIQVSIVYFN